ncbi:nucleotide pyrophosphohydrolase [Anaerolentibacter hominis]|uniref:nucleotide pyrophosphohydrolase n=1 Tax=Anaerolentibacter hominis TaxID=3079009 RepID=UPI0031B816E1
MDQKTTLQTLKDMVGLFCKERDWDQFNNPKDLAIGITTEAGELLDIFRFKTQEQVIEMFGLPGKREKIEDELADVLFFTLRFAQMNEIDLSEILERKTEKNRQKYPVEIVRGRNLKYSEYEGD